MSDNHQSTQPARSFPRGLATVALLKARFDQGVDHIDMFMPLVVETIESALPLRMFSSLCINGMERFGFTVTTWRTVALSD